MANHSSSLGQLHFFIITSSEGGKQGDDVGLKTIAIFEKNI